jgi:hypothetical protein
MSGLAMFNLAASSTGNGAGAALARVAKAWIDSLLSKLRYLDALDLAIGAGQPGAFDPRVAALLHGMYEDWARCAGAAEERLKQFPRDSLPVQDLLALSDAHGRIMARLQVTPQDVENSRREIAAGRVTPASQLRDELRSSARR